MQEPDTMVVETITRILTERCEPEVVMAAEDGEWPDALWAALDEACLPLAWVPEALGGPGTALVDGFAVAEVAGAFAAPVPLAETLLAGWLLARGGLEPGEGPMSVAPVMSGDGIALAADGTLDGTAHRVPFAARSRSLAVLATNPDGRPMVARVAVAGCTVEPASNLAGEPRETVRLDRVTPLAVSAALDGDPGEALRRMGAALRAYQMAGALSRILEQSLGYASERSQFGRTISKFQAVQHNLAMLAEEVGAAGAASAAAASAITRFGIDDPRTFLAVASAKIRVGEAAGAGAGIAHQVHGAMGFTREYSLHHRTRRLWSWRDEFGPESVWAIELGTEVCAGGAEALWSALTEL